MSRCTCTASPTTGSRRSSTGIDATCLARTQQRRVPTWRMSGTRRVSGRTSPKAEPRIPALLLCLKRRLDRGSDPIQSRYGSGGLQNSKLRERSDPVIEAHFLGDFAILDTEHGCPSEVHLPTGCCRQRAREKIAKPRAGMGAATFPSTDDMVALGDEIGSAPEFEIGECGAEIHHEIPHVVTASTRCM